MNTPIQQTHAGIVITYDERENKWTFTLRGRDKSSNSLADAKAIIDKPVPKDKAKPFQKIPAWFFKYNDGVKKIEVTGIAENSYTHQEYVWINDDGRRSKEAVRANIYPQTETNDICVGHIIAKEEQIAKLEDEIYELKWSLAPLVLPKDE